MPRRYVIVAVVLAALAVGFFVLRTRETLNADRPSQAPAPDKTSVRRSSPALHSIFQRLPVHLETVADAGLRTGPTNGGFEGRVVSALTGNGLPGAQLTFAHNGQVSSVSGAPDGSFHFEPHVAGLWLLAATTAPAHLPFAPEWGLSPVLLEARPNELVRGITVALSPAQEFEGRVVDPKDQPVAGADITVLGGGAGATTLVPLENRFRSDSRGMFRFIAPDDAIVEATHEGFASGRAQVDYSVRLSRKLTVRLRPIAEAHFSIEGTVIDQDGSPAEGAVVSATLKGRPTAFAMTTRVDVDGRFKLLDLEGGTWTLAASRPGSAPAFAEVAAGTIGVRLGPAVVSVVAPGHAPSAEVRVTIPDPGAGTATADFDLSAGGSLTGFVLERGTDAGIPGALVEVEGTPPSLGVPIRNDTLTDGDGGFTLNALAETTVGIQASAAGHHARIISVPPIPEGETTGPLTIELTPLKVGEDAGVELAGIGAALQKNGDVFVVVRVVPNSGAAEVGLAAGDAVTSINEVPVKPMTLTDAVPLLRGPEGTTVRLVVVKAGNPPQTVTLIVPRRVVRG